MSIGKVLRNGIALAAAGTVCFSCGKDAGLNLEGNDCSIISASIISGDKEIPVQIYPDRLAVTLDYNFDFSTATVEYSLSEGAAIYPDPSEADLSGETTFTVTSANGKNSKTYSYSVNFDSVESYCKENIYLASQEDVDNFGRNSYTRVWSVVVNGSESSPITDLSPLNSLKTIDHNFTVKGFQGREICLDNLCSVSSIDIVKDALDRISFANISETDNLMLGMLNEDGSYSEYISVSEVNFGKLTAVRNNFVVNLSFTDGGGQEGFGSLKTIYEGYLGLIGVDDMRIFSSLENAYYLTICSKSESLEGLEHIKTIEGSLSLKFCSYITDTDGLSPDKVGEIVIDNCTRLENLNSFGKITEVSTVSLNGTPKLTDISGLSNLKRIEDKLYFRWTGLKDLDSFSNLEHVGNLILLNYNSSLEDFSGLKKCLESFSGTYDVKGNKQNPAIDDIIG